MRPATTRRHPSDQSDCFFISHDFYLRVTKVNKQEEAMDAEKLIGSVHSFECLGDMKNPGYKDRRKRENAWKEVSHEVRSRCLAY